MDVEWDVVDVIAGYESEKLTPEKPEADRQAESRPKWLTTPSLSPVGPKRMNNYCLLLS